jgi:hypothetical protein
VSYEGKAFVRVHGKQVKQIAPEKAQALLQHFANARLFDMRSEYVEAITDNPTANVTFTMGGRTKTIRDYPPCHSKEFGSTGTPTELCALETEMDEVTGTAAWVECKNDADVPYCRTL